MEIIIPLKSVQRCPFNIISQALNMLVMQASISMKNIYSCLKCLVLIDNPMGKTLIIAKQKGERVRCTRTPDLRELSMFVSMMSPIIKYKEPAVPYNT